ncbi:hypothetical protein [Paenibacillus taichungensis]
MQSLNFALELFKKSGVPFKLSGEESTERELKVTRLVVNKEHVLKGHVQTYLKIIESLEKKKQKGRSSLVILFDGYDKDIRKMYDVPEIKSWVQKIVKNKPHLFYFLVNANDNYVHDLALCMVTPFTNIVPKALQDYIKTSSDLVLSGADVTPAIRKVTESAFMYAKKLKHSPEDLMDLCMTLLDNMSYEQHLKESKQRLQDA